MKKIALFLLVLFLTQTVEAQDCGSYFVYRKGQKMELTSYDKKDKMVALLKYEVLDYKPINGGTSLVFNVETYDAKGALLAKGQSSGKCVNGSYYTDVTNVSSAMVPKAANMTVDISGDQLVYPSALNPGDQLKDATYSIKSGMQGGMTLMTLNVNVVDRKVVGLETVTTPAGSFECLKITYTMNMRFMGNRSMNCVEYLAKGIGVVKSEQSDDKGRNQSMMVLTKLEK